MLSHLKVVELTTVLAGPQVGMFFSELGAQTLKIEPIAGDVTRTWRHKTEYTDEKDISAYFACCNYNKKYKRYCYNANASEVRQHIAEADILLCNWSSQEKASEYLLDYEYIKNNVNSKIIYGNIKGFLDQPDRAAYDAVLQAETGILSIVGDGKSFQKLPIAYIDLFAAHQLKEGILLALLRQQKEDTPFFVEASLEGAGIASLANFATNYLMNGVIPKPMGLRHPNISPYGDIVRTSDGIDFVLAIGSDTQFKNLWEKVLELPSTSLEKYKLNHDRVKCIDEIMEILSPAVQKLGSEEFGTRCHELRIPVGEIRNIKEVFRKAPDSVVLNERIGNVDSKRAATVGFTITS